MCALPPPSSYRREGKLSDLGSTERSRKRGNVTSRAKKKKVVSDLFPGKMGVSWASVPIPSAAALIPSGVFLFQEPPPRFLPGPTGIRRAWSGSDGKQPAK